MPEPQRPTDRTPAQREADHAALGRLSESLVPALVAKLNASGLGELEVHEGDWKVRLRRSGSAGTAQRRAERPRVTAASAERRDAAVHAPAAHAAGTRTSEPAPDGKRELATSPAVGVFRPVAKVGGTVRSGDRIAVVDLLGIPQDVVAPIDGVVVEMLVEAGQAVEYGEPLAAVEVPQEPAAGATPDREG